MSIPKIIIEDYIFQDFILKGTQLRFHVASVSGSELTEVDQQKVESLLSHLGKWECLVKTGFQFLSDLGFIHHDSSTLIESETLGGPEQYSMGVGLGPSPDLFTGFMTLTGAERIRREVLGLKLLGVEEVQGQLSNIPKWKNFEKSLKFLKNQ